MLPLRYLPLSYHFISLFNFMLSLHYLPLCYLFTIYLYVTSSLFTFMLPLRYLPLYYHSTWPSCTCRCRGVCVTDVKGTFCVFYRHVFYIRWTLHQMFPSNTKYVDIVLHHQFSTCFGSSCHRQANVVTKSCCVRTECHAECRYSKLMLKGFNRYVLGTSMM